MIDILVTGGSGQLGTELQALSWPPGMRLLAPSRRDADLADRHGLERWLDAHRPAAIVSAGAFTAVDRAETEVAEAWAVNALAPAVLAAHAGRAGIPIVHLSTDYVFDGSGALPWREDDPVRPLGVYGASKAAGEMAVATAAARHVILRTAWLVSPHGGNFVKTMLRLGAVRPLLRVVDDQYGNPTIAADLAVAVRTVVLAMIADPAAPTGVFHFAGAGATTWCGFAREIFAVAARLGGPAPAIEAIATADYPTPARRPANSRLATDRLATAYGVAVPSWRSGLEHLVAALLPAACAGRAS